MTRRDFVAIAVLVTLGATVAVALKDENEREILSFTSEHVVRIDDPDVSVLYLTPEYKESAHP